MSDQPSDASWWTVRECANRWRVSKSTVTRWLEAGELKGKHEGGRWWVSSGEVASFESDGIPKPVPVEHPPIPLEDRPPIFPAGEQADYVFALIERVRSLKKRVQILEGREKEVARRERLAASQEMHDAPPCLEELRQRVIPCRAPIDSRAAVYFLFLGDELVYVGQAISVLRRVGTHVIEGQKEFDSVFYLPVELCELNRVEGEMIRRFRPRFNRSGGPKVPAEAR